MIIHREFEQGSCDWLNFRAGLVTASEFKNIVTPKFKLREGEMLHSYLASKLAEKWTGEPAMSGGTFAMDQGSLLEDKAIPWLAMELGKPIERVGLITSDCGRYACSPDGILPGEIGVESKCCEAKNHVKHLLGGVVPDEYLAQINFSLYVTGWKEWKFLAYRKRFPNLVLTVERDEAIMAKIKEALDSFLELLDEGMRTLVKLNGGQPPPKRIVPQPMVFSTAEPDDIIP